MDPFLVVGGGVSGIAAAHYLHEAGLPVELLERDGVLGGRVAPAELEGRPIELGGKNIGHRYRYFRAFVQRMGGSEFEYFGINSSRVGRDGQLITVDGTRRWRSALGLLRSCSPRDLARFVRLALRVWRSESEGFLGGRYFGALGERSDDRPLADWFSRQFADAVLRPLSLRMNGAEPDEVFLGSLGTNLRSLFDSYDQPTSGMRGIFARFAAKVPVHLGITVRSVKVRAGKVVAVETEGRDGRREERPCAGIVLATPAGGAAQLLAPLSPGAGAALGSVRYFPVQVVVARYARPVFTPEVRAIVFDASCPLSNAGAYGTAALDVVRYTFSGRVARGLLAQGDSGSRAASVAQSGALLEAGEALLGRHLPVRRADRMSYVGRRFDPGLCAYAPRHARLEKTLLAAEAEIGGLALTGDYVRGASIEACFRAAHGAAHRLLAQVS